MRNCGASIYMRGSFKKRSYGLSQVNVEKHKNWGATALNDKKYEANGNVILVTGWGNVTAGRDVIQVQKAPVVRNVISPGPEHIDEVQRRAITDLRGEWVALHNTLKKRKLPDAAAWVLINKAAGSTSYHLIRSEKFELVMQYIRQQMAVLRSMKSAPSKDDQWRVKRIAAIKTRCRNQLNDPGAYRPYIRKNFKLESLADLATDQLQKTYSYIMAKK